MWRWMFNSDVGMIGDMMVQWGLVSSPPLFLVDPALAKWALVIAQVWKGMSMTAVFLMGGLALVPKELHDAAKVDGALGWRRFWTVTMPTIMPTVLVTLLFRTMYALRAFDIVYGLTNGGPGSTTETLSSFAYKYYFQYAQFGLGSAYAVVTFLMILGASLIYIKSVQSHFRFKGMEGT